MPHPRYPQADPDLTQGRLTQALTEQLDELTHASHYYGRTPPATAIGEVLDWAATVEATEAEQEGPA